MTLGARLRNRYRGARERSLLFRARRPHVASALKRAAVVGGLVGGLALRSRHLGKLSKFAYAESKALRRAGGAARIKGRVLRTKAYRARLGAAVTLGGGIPYSFSPVAQFRGEMRRRKKAALHIKPVTVIHRRGGRIVQIRQI